MLTLKRGLFVLVIVNGFAEPRLLIAKTVSRFFMKEKIQEINIAAEIRAELARQKHSVAWLAKQIGYDPSNLNKYLKRDGHLYSIELLLKISICLKIDFFQKYSQYLKSAIQ